MIIVKIMKTEAMELLEAKKPRAVEIRPVTASASEANPTIGAKKTDSMLPLQEKKGRKASLMLVKNVDQEKSFMKKRLVKVAGYLMSS